MTADEVQVLFDGLEKNDLTDDYTHVLTGYIGNYAILEKIEKMVQKLKVKNPNLIYGKLQLIYLTGSYTDMFRWKYSL